MYNTGIPLPPQQTAPQGMQQPMQPQQGTQQRIANTGLGAQSPFTVPGMGNMMLGNPFASGQNPFAVPGMGAPPPANPMATQPPMTPPATAPGPMTQPGFPANPNVSMPIGASPMAEGYAGMGGMGGMGALMDFFRSIMGQGAAAAPRMAGYDIPDMLGRMRSRQGDPRRDNLFRRYGARPMPQQPGMAPDYGAAPDVELDRYGVMPQQMY
jgi:hypothetical protein